MRNKRTGLAKWLDYIAVCIGVYLIAFFFFSRMGTKGAILPWAAFFLAVPVILLFMLGRRRSRRFPGKGKRDAALRNEWLMQLMLMSPAECLAVLKPLMIRKYSLLDAEIKRDNKSAIPYITCRYNGQRLAITCVRTVTIDTIINLAATAIDESADSAILCSLTPIPEAPDNLPITITPYGPHRVKNLMPADFCAKETVKQKKSSFIAKFVREVFSKEKAMRYLLYGFGLVMLYFLMGFSYALLPGIVCFVLAALSHIWPAPKDALI